MNCTECKKIRFIHECTFYTGLNDMFTQIVVKKYLNIQGVKFHSFSLTGQKVFLPLTYVILTCMKLYIRIINYINFCY